MALTSNTRFESLAFPAPPRRSCAPSPRARASKPITSQEVRLARGPEGALRQHTRRASAASRCPIRIAGAVPLAAVPGTSPARTRPGGGRSRRTIPRRRRRCARSRRSSVCGPSGLATRTISSSPGRTSRRAAERREPSPMARGRRPSTPRRRRSRSRRPRSEFSPAVAALIIGHSKPPVSKAGGSAKATRHSSRRLCGHRWAYNPERLQRCRQGLSRPAEGAQPWSTIETRHAGSWQSTRGGGRPFELRPDFSAWRARRNGLGTQALKAASLIRADPGRWQAADPVRHAEPAMTACGLGTRATVASSSRRAIRGRSLGTSTGNNAWRRGSVHRRPRRDLAAARRIGRNRGSPRRRPAPADTGNALQRLLTKPPPTKDAQGNDGRGQSRRCRSLAGAVGDVAQKSAPEVAPMQPIMPAQDPDPGLAPAASQLFQTVQQAAMRAAHVVLTTLWLERGPATWARLSNATGIRLQWLTTRRDRLHHRVAWLR